MLNYCYGKRETKTCIPKYTYIGYIWYYFSIIFLKAFYKFSEFYGGWTVYACTMLRERGEKECEDVGIVVAILYWHFGWQMHLIT